MTKKKKIGICVIVLSFIIMVGLGVFFTYNYSRGLTKIDNFDDYYYNVPAETKRIIFAELYSTLAANVSDEIPSDGAVIRGDAPYLYNYNDSYNGFTGKFIVDIPKIQQSYLVRFDFAENPEELLGGYAALVYCLKEDEMIYPDFNCQEVLPFTHDNKGSSIYE